MTLCVCACVYICVLWYARTLFDKQVFYPQPNKTLMILTTKVNQVAKQKAIIKETQVQRGEAIQSFSFRVFPPHLSGKWAGKRLPHSPGSQNGGGGPKMCKLCILPSSCGKSGKGNDQTNSQLGNKQCALPGEDAHSCLE